MEEARDVHDYQKSLDSIQRRIASDAQIHSANRRHIQKFIDYCYVTDMRPSSITKDLYSLWFFARNLKKDFSRANKDDFGRLIRMVGTQNWAEHTKRNHRVAIKKFMRWLKGTKKTYPPEVEDISTSGKRERSILPEEILSNDEVERMITASENIRDRTLVMVLALLGARIGEALNMKVKHVRFEETGEVVCMLIGKTGYRTVVSIPLAPQLANFIENAHPTKNPEDFLFLTKRNMFGGRRVVGKRFDHKLNTYVDVGRTVYVPLSYGGARKMLRLVAERSGIKKKVSPHWFRRYAATQDATYMSDRLMMLKYGWSTPEVVGVYSRLSSQSLIDAERKRHGRLSENGAPKLTVITCPRCRLDNPPGGKFCGKCGMVLSADVAMKLRRVEDARSAMMLSPMHQRLLKEFLRWVKKKRKPKQSHRSRRALSTS